MNRLLFLLMMLFLLGYAGAVKAQDEQIMYIQPMQTLTIVQRSAIEDSIMYRYAKLRQWQNGNTLPDTIRLAKPRKKRITEYNNYFILTYDFYTTLIGQKTENAESITSERDNLYFYYNVTVNNRLYIKPFRLTTYFFNEFGKKFYFDSSGAKSDDLYYLKNTLNYPVIKNVLDVNAMVNVKSQFWKTYAYREGANGEMERYLYSSYFTPGYILYSAGLTYNFWSGSTIELGLVSGKITKLKNQAIWDERQSKTLYGVEQGKKTKVDFGLNLTINVLAKKFGKHFVWEHYGQAYMSNEHFGDITYVTCDFNNAFHYLFLKYLRFTLRTKVTYDMYLQEKPLIVNQFSLGFYLSNIIR